jgi:Protein of unknown function (DUF3716)
MPLTQAATEVKNVTDLDIPATLPTDPTELSNLIERLGRRVNKKLILQLFVMVKDRKREIHLRPLQKLKITRQTSFVGCLMQMFGDEAKVGCSHCQKNNRPFTTCVMMKGFANGSCAGCYYQSAGRDCTLRAAAAVTTPSLTRKRPISISSSDTETVETPVKRTKKAKNQAKHPAKSPTRKTEPKPKKPGRSLTRDNKGYKQLKAELKIKAKREWLAKQFKKVRNGLSWLEEYIIQIEEAVVESDLPTDTDESEEEASRRNFR